MRHLILTAYKSRKSGQLSMPRWIYLITTIPTLTILGVGILLYFINVRRTNVSKDQDLQVSHN